MNYCSKISFILILIYLSFSLIIIYSCTKSDSNSDAAPISINNNLDHPIRTYMPEWQNMYTISNEMLNDIHLNTDEIKKYKHTFSIGNNPDTILDFFGDITDIASDSENNIYILDDRIPVIKKFSPSGNLISMTSGNRGRGPNDLFEPKSIAVTGDGKRIFVADRFNEIKIFNSVDENIIYSNSFFTPEMIANDMCIIENELFIRSLGITSSETYHLIHVYSLNNYNHIRSFGDIYNSPRLNTNLTLSANGKIGCNTKSKTISYTFQFFPYIYTYTTTGSFNWVTELFPFTQMKLNETVTNGNTISWEFDYQGSRIESIQPFLNDNLIVTIITNYNDQPVDISNFILSFNDGRGMHLEDSNYWVLHSYRNYLYTKNINNNIFTNIYKHSE